MAFFKDRLEKHSNSQINNFSREYFVILTGDLLSLPQIDRFFMWWFRVHILNIYEDIFSKTFTTGLLVLCD